MLIHRKPEGNPEQSTILKASHEPVDNAHQGSTRAAQGKATKMSYVVAGKLPPPSAAPTSSAAAMGRSRRSLHYEVPDAGPEDTLV